MKQISRYISNKIVASNITATNDNIQQIVKYELKRLGHDADLNHIDVSEVTNMENLFCVNDDVAYLKFRFPIGPNFADLNPDISRWDVSNVVKAGYMFYECKNFNCDLSTWTPDKLEDAQYMFCNAELFDSDLTQWQLTKLINTRGMFSGAKSFNSNISNWKMSNAEDVSYMFYNAEKFDQDLSKWNITRAIKAYEYFDMFTNSAMTQNHKPRIRK